jgi:hypothetical protein
MAVRARQLLLLVDADDLAAERAGGEKREQPGISIENDGLGSLCEKPPIWNACARHAPLQYLRMRTSSRRPRMGQRLRSRPSCSIPFRRPS